MNNLLSTTGEAWNWPYWGIMVGINVISFAIMVFILIKMILDYKKDKVNGKYRLILSIFGMIYCSVALYRSAFISSYTGLKGWFGITANSSFVIRCLATFAEISFAIVIGVVLMHMNKQVALPEYVYKHPWFEKFLKFSPWLIIICLSIAQFFAWSGLLTQYIFLFAIEETLWCLGFVCILPLLLVQTINLFKNFKHERRLTYYKVFVMVLCVFTIGYALFQICYQLPFGYYLEIADDMVNGVHYGINAESFNRIITVVNQTRTFEDWGGIGFFIWHSGYFSLAVWMTLLFASGPRVNDDGFVHRRA